MDFTSRNLLLDDDINRIKNGHDVSRNTTSFSGVLHLEKEDIELEGFLISVDTTRDFNNSVSDTHIVRFYIANGVYYKKVEAEKDNLYITLTKKEGIRTRVETFKFVIVNNEQGNTGTYLENNTQESLDKDGLKNVIGQAINTTYYATRLITTPLTMRRTTIDKALLVAFNDFLSNTRDIRINGTPLSIDKLNIDIPDNINFYNNITIDSNITIVDVPTFLQEEYGVYNGYLGTYIAKEYITGDEKGLKDSVYVYPLYNPESVKLKKRKLRLYAEKGATSAFIETTFVNSENSLDILCSAEKTSKQVFAKHSANEGAGFSMLDANYVTKENTSNNDKENMFLKQAYDKKDGVPFSRNVGISSNAFKERSNVLKNTGTTLVVTWNFSVPELVYPGMPVEYIYETITGVKPEIKVITGIVQAMNSSVDNNKRNCNSNLFIFLNGISSEEK